TEMWRLEIGDNGCDTWLWRYLDTFERVANAHERQ
ncbi:MAG: hypothetical protein ACI84C_002442, partial [Flavobacteriales bacterium]